MTWLLSIGLLGVTIYLFYTGSPLFAVPVEIIRAFDAASRLVKK